MQCVNDPTESQKHNKTTRSTVESTFETTTNSLSAEASVDEPDPQPVSLPPSEYHGCFGRPTHCNTCLPCCTWVSSSTCCRQNMNTFATGTCKKRSASTNKAHATPTLRELRPFPVECRSTPQENSRLQTMMDGNPSEV
jgi:hypothetical protein